MVRVCRRVFLVGLLSLLTFGSVHAESEYTAKTFDSPSGKQLRYRLLVPEKYDPQGDQSYPIVLFLHGAGERGDDNVRPLVHGTKHFATPENRDKYPAFVVVPQCPEGKRWVEVDWSLDQHQQLPDDSDSIQLVLELMKQLEQDYRIDARRRYVTGLSMGGYGTWDLVTRHPEMWAAAAPVCGGGDEATAARVTKIPIWAFHGEQDTVVKPARSRKMIDAIRAAGGKPRYTEYPGVGHDSWNPAYSDPELLKWMFNQRQP